MRLVPFFYMSFGKSGLTLKQVKSEDGKTKVLKVIRER
jgi:hypothetical protein